MATGTLTRDGPKQRWSALSTSRRVLLVVAAVLLAIGPLLVTLGRQDDYDARIDVVVRTPPPLVKNAFRTGEPSVEVAQVLGKLKARNWVPADIRFTTDGTPEISDPRIRPGTRTADATTVSFTVTADSPENARSLARALSRSLELQASLSYRRPATLLRIAIARALRKKGQSIQTRGALRRQGKAYGAFSRGALPITLESIAGRGGGRPLPRANPAEAALAGASLAVALLVAVFLAPSLPTLVGAGALAAAGVLLLLTGWPAWALLVLCVALTLAIVVWAALRGRFFEPLPVIAALAAVFFLSRPLQLFLDWRALYDYTRPPASEHSLVLLKYQELARYVSNRLADPLQSALTRPMAACVVFLIMVVLGYRVGLGRRLAGNLAGVGAATERLNVRAAVAASLVIGLAAQVAILVRVGGPAESLKTSLEQTTLSQGLVLYLLAGFSIVALLVWAAWHRPESRREWTLFWLAVASVCGFSVLAGSRDRVFITLLALATIKHYRWSPWRLRQLAVCLVVFLVFASGFVAFRQATDRQSLGGAAGTAAKYALDPRVVLNDITSFDFLLYATQTYGRPQWEVTRGPVRARPYQHGAWLVDSARSYVPAAIDPGKPKGGDIRLRDAVWGNQYKAGRPPTVVGDFYIDFGFFGVAVGALLLGIAARSLLGLVRDSVPGQAFRVAAYSIALVVLYELVAGTYSLALGSALILGLPFLVAVHGFGRLSRD